MAWFYNLKISVKLLISFTIVALIAGTVGVVGILSLKTIDEDYSQLYALYGIPLADIGEVAVLYQRSRVNLRDIIIDKGSSDRSAYVENLRGFDKSIQEELGKFGKEIERESSEETKKEFDNLKSLIDNYAPIKEKIISLALANKEDEALALLRGEGFVLAQAIDDSIGKLFENRVTNGGINSEVYSKEAATSVSIMIVIVALAVLVAIALGIFIARIISRPIISLAQTADKLALGDINVNIDSRTKDEIGALTESFGRMVSNIREQAYAVEKIADGDLTVQIKVRSESDLLGKKLSEMVKINNETLGNINSAAEQVNAGARQVSDSSQALSQGSTEQASSIEEITSAMEQVASQTKQNALNANQANELAVAAKNNAIQGNEQMKEMLKAMQDINDSSTNISKIIKVIDEIAFQTNILALNAAVEAARAGQHGKGFAVVAEEVRNLAARSANAAKETTDMIEGSIKKAEIGTRIASDTADALGKIVDGVTRSANLVGEIAAASNEQASGITQVNEAIAQVSMVTQTNSSTAEESAAASEELSSQAELLKDMVSRFKLSKSGSMLSKLENLDPTIIRMLEDMANKKESSHLNHISNRRTEADLSADTARYGDGKSSKIKISLSDKDFGKY